MRHLFFVSVLAASAAVVLAAPAPVFAQTTEAASIDPARLAIAGRVSARLIPDGIYKKIMSGTMDQMMDGIMAQVGTMPLSTFAPMAGLSESELAAMPKATLNEMMAIVDPAFEVRTQRMMKVMFAEMGDLMGGMEPELRAGMTEAYAKRFSVEQLTELDRFFATPTGTIYAAEQMTLMMDPAVMSKMQTMVPKIMEAMPAIMKKVEASTSDLPPPSRGKALTADQKRRLEALLGKAAN